jgi:hypothetical protein
VQVAGSAWTELLQTYLDELFEEAIDQLIMSEKTLWNFETFGFSVT